MINTTLGKVKQCDKCGSMIRDTKYPWYSYYSPKGEATDILFRYCNESKNEIIKLYGIESDYFSRSTDDKEEEETSIQYFESRKKY